MSFCLAILIPTVVGLRLHRRLGPNRGTALFVIAGFILGTAIGLTLLHRREQRRFDPDRLLAKYACLLPADARIASFRSLDVTVMEDYAVAHGRTDISRSVRLVDAQDKSVIELRVDGRSSSSGRDARVRRAQTAILVEGNTVQRVPLRSEVHCAGT